MLWRRPLVRREKIVVERRVGAWECVCSREIELLSVVWIEGRGFVVELRFWRVLSACIYDESDDLSTKRRKSFRVYMRKRRNGNGRREGERERQCATLTAVEYTLLASSIWDIPG
jgi:hypothetical protein